MSNEPIEPLELTEQDMEDIEKMNSEGEEAPPAPQPRTLLEVWKELLANIDTERDNKIPLPIAQRIVSTWPQLTFGDVTTYMSLYYEYLDQMRQVVLEEIISDPDALENVEDDATENWDHYRSILFGWHKLAVEWQHDWSTDDSDAAVNMAAIIDAHGFFLSQTGLVAHLQEIKFEFGPEDQEALQKDLTEFEAGL